MKQLPGYSWVEVSERALVANIRAHRRLIGSKVKLMAVVKSNAYGHGLELTARVAQRSRQVDWLGVANINEALVLRASDITLPILVLSYFRPFVQQDLIKAISNRISFVVYELEQIKALEQAARHTGKRAAVHLKIETGMARLGIMPHDALNFIKKISTSPYLKLEGLASHLATAESRNQTFLNKQLLQFDNFISSVKATVPNDILRHIACSAAISTSSKSHNSLVRLGIALYGLWPSDENKEMAISRNPKFKLTPALTWKTQVIEVQKLPAGTPVGYDNTYVTKRPTVMAAIPIGYYDGFDRKLSNTGEVIIRNKICHVIGRVCMNITMIDVTDITGVVVGDEVIIIGKNRDAEIEVNKIAKVVGTINYEIVTRINPALPRILV